MAAEFAGELAAEPNRECAGELAAEPNRECAGELVAEPNRVTGELVAEPNLVICRGLIKSLLTRVPLPAKSYVVEPAAPLAPKSYVVEPAAPWAPGNGDAARTAVVGFAASSIKS